MEELNRIANKLIENKQTLKISRVPEKTKKAFVELAQSDFCDDYGMTLKYVLDFYFGSIPKGTESIDLKIDVLAEEVIALRKDLEELKEKRKSIRMLDGRIVKKS